MTDIVQLKTISRHDSWIVGWLDHLDGHCPTQDSSRHASQNSVPSQHGTNLIHLFSLITVRRHVVSSHFSLTKCVCGGNSCDSIAPFSWQKTKTKKIFVWVIHVAVSKHTQKQNETKQQQNTKKDSTLCSSSSSSTNSNKNNNNHNNNNKYFFCNEADVLINFWESWKSNRKWNSSL